MKESNRFCKLRSLSTQVPSSDLETQSFDRVTSGPGMKAVSLAQTTSARARFFADTAATPARCCLSLSGGGSCPVALAPLSESGLSRGGWPKSRDGRPVPAWFCFLARRACRRRLNDAAHGVGTQRPSLRPSERALPLL